MSSIDHSLTFSLLFSPSLPSSISLNNLLPPPNSISSIHLPIGALISFTLAILLIFNFNRLSFTFTSSSPSSPPVLPTWPWLGSLFAYTRDPVGFIRRNHARYGDIFTTTILGYRCTFIQSAAHVHRFATAPRSLLDVTGAYKLIASGVIGEEAFIGPTRTLTRLVLAPARLDSLDDRLWDLAQEMISQDKLNLSTKQWTTVTPTGWLDDVIFALDLAALMGPTSPGLLQPVAGHFRVLDSDLSLLGLLTGGRARTRAKDSLIQLLRQHVRHHLCLAARRVSDPQSSISAEAELPELLLRSELEAPCNGEVDECLRAYHEGTSTEAMLELIECKVNYVALFIYGFVWAAQTNSAAATISALYDILHHAQTTGEDLVEEIRAELDTAGGIGLATYRETGCLTRCINETLRLRATGAWVRLSESGFDLKNGITCPSGLVVVSPTSISHQAEVYPNSTQWDPNRYLRSPFRTSIPLDSRTWIPSPSKFPAWGVGHSHCPGQHLAYKMISITLLTFFHHFDARLAPSSSSPVFQDVAAAGLQRLQSAYKIQIRKRTSL